MTVLLFKKVLGYIRGGLAPCVVSEALPCVLVHFMLDITSGSNRDIHHN
jgi:hypothetical protein